MRRTVHFLERNLRWPRAGLHATIFNSNQLNFNPPTNQLRRTTPFMKADNSATVT